MKKLIKLVPMMALLLGLGVYTVNAKMKALEAEHAQTDQEWTLTGTDRTDPMSSFPISALQRKRREHRPRKVNLVCWTAGIWMSMFVARKWR